MDFELSSEHSMLRDMVGDFARREITREYLRETDAEHRFPRELWQRLLAAGIMEWPMPKSVGGVGGDLLGTTVIVEELCRGSFALGVIYLTEAFSAVNLLADHGSAEQQELLTELTAGRALFAFGFTEPGGGQDVLGAMRTRAKPDGSGFVLNGAKIFTTMAGDSSHVIVLARTSDGARRHEGLTMFLVPADAPGVTINRLATIAYHSTATCEVFFEDVALPETSVIGDLDAGWRQIVGSLDMEKVVIAASAVGLARAALEDATQYAKQRTAFGGPIGRFQAIQHELARCEMQLEAARLLTYRAAWAAGRGGRFTVEATRAKVAATEAAVATTDCGMRVLAGYGVMSEFDMQRYFRDARVILFGPITNEMGLNILGEQALGLPRSY
jgi:acyl-CoA dehydrogenase